MSELVFTGLGVSEGLGAGRVQRVDRRRLAVPHLRLEPAARAREVERLEQALRASEAQLAALAVRAEDAGLGQAGRLLATHAAMLRDPALEGATRDRILNEGQNAEWALQRTVRELKQLFDRLDHDYFRERRSDVDVVGDRVLGNLVGEATDLVEDVAEDAVIVAFDLSPADAVALARFAARAFVTELGGRTSHTAILARALGVPCVLGARGLMAAAASGDGILVDGGAGEVVLRPAEASRERHRALDARRRREARAHLADRDLPAETADGARVELLGNIEVSQEVESALLHGAEGIGLYRTEFLLVERPGLAGADAHHEAYRGVVEALAGRPVTLRTLDLGADKQLGGRGPAATGSPLGLRGLRLSLGDPAGFREQLEGIARASAHGPVRLLLPFVTSVEELRAARGLVREVQRALDARGVAHDPSLPVGAMLETPAAALTVDALAREADFFAVGTNDLVQYLLAADRGREEVAHLYRPCHPAVVRALAAIARTAREVGRPVSVCGELAADPDLVPLLLGLGFRSLSMTARAIPSVKRRVRAGTLAACEALAARALAADTAEEVEALVAAHARAAGLSGRPPA